MSNVKVKAPKKPVKPVIVVIYILLVILAVIYLAPLLWMLSVSLKDNAGVMSAPFSLPEVFHFENYAQAWQMGKLGTALINSVIVCGATLIVSLFFGAMAAFAIARMRWKLSEFMHTFFLIGMMVPVHCVLIPFCKICKTWSYQFPGRIDDSLYYLLPANDHFPAYRIFPFHARRNVRGCCH